MSEDAPTHAAGGKPGQARQLGRVLLTSAACAPLLDVYRAAESDKATTWVQIEKRFVRAMEQFDANLVDGLGGMADLQNGKGDFFSDLLALLLENSTGTQLFSRASVPGLIFPSHNLDVTYPRTGQVGFLVEAKALGTPKYAGNPKASALGRGGAADVDKRIKEMAFKAIDLKLEYGRRQLMAGTQAQRGVGGDLTGWLRTAQPKIFLFMVARVIGKSDYDALIRSASRAALIMDAVGVYCFQPVDPAKPTTYEPVKVPDTLELERVLFRARQDLESLQPSATRPSDN